MKKGRINKGRISKGVGGPVQRRGGPGGPPGIDRFVPTRNLSLSDEADLAKSTFPCRCHVKVAR